MASATEIGGDIVAAASAIAGLMLVYMGALSASFGGFLPKERPAVRPSFQKRVWFAFLGLVFNVAAIPVGLTAKGLDSRSALFLALGLLALGLGSLIAVAVLTAREIK